MIRSWLLATALVGCKYNPPENPANGDGGVDVMVDAGPCQSLEDRVCLSATELGVCEIMGELPTPFACVWGCSNTNGAHCQQIVPSGGALVVGDTDPMVLGTLGAVTVGGGIDTDAGTIENATAPTDFTYTQLARVGVFRVKSLTIDTQLTVSGSRALAIVADGPIVITAAIDLHGCTGNNGLRTPGPGGNAGGLQGSGGTSGVGNGGGELGISGANGGGGGGYGGIGGVGGGAGGAAGGAAGPSFGVIELTTLEGGGGGGGSKGGQGGVGGGGGGAIQLVSNTSITISSDGSIDAGGCGGGGTTNDGGNDAGGGGGAGGAILLEAPLITIAGELAVNGGGGGGSGQSGGPGDPGTLGRTGGGAGGATSTNGAEGGAGAAGAVLDGGPGTTATKSSGGGGAIGRIRFNVLAGTTPTVDNTKLSPALDDVPTTCTAGEAAVQ